MLKGPRWQLARTIFHVTDVHRDSISGLILISTAKFSSQDTVACSEHVPSGVCPVFKLGGVWGGRSPPTGMAWNQHTALLSS